MKHARIVRYVLETPWAIRPEALGAILEAVSLYAEGGRFPADQLAERIGSGPAGRPPEKQGAVAVLPLYGTIMPRANLFSEISGGTSLQRFGAAFREAIADDSIGSILLDVDSPGGMVDLVPETAAEIRAARGRKPIVAVANTEAASAAYWIASQAEELVVTPSGMVGSIGVFALHDDISRMQANMGWKTTLISAGRFKTEGNPFEPLSDEAQAAIQSMADEYYGMFVGDVARGRSVGPADVRRGFGEGRMVTARTALAEGMADRVATFEAVLADLVRGRSPVSRPKARGSADAAADHQELEQIHLVLDSQLLVHSLVAVAIPSHDTEVIDEPWDGPAEEAKIPNDSGQSVLERMYAWRDGEADADAKAAYALPHHKVVDEEPGPANVRGVRNALARLPQSRVPSSEHPAVRRHLQVHLDAFNDEESSSASILPGAERLLRYPAIRQAVRPAP